MRTGVTYFLENPRAFMASRARRAREAREAIPPLYGWLSARGGERERDHSQTQASERRSIALLGFATAICVGLSGAWLREGEAERVHLLN